MLSIVNCSERPKVCKKDEMYPTWHILPVNSCLFTGNLYKQIDKFRNTNDDFVRFYLCGTVIRRLDLDSMIDGVFGESCTRNGRFFLLWKCRLFGLSSKSCNVSTITVYSGMIKPTSILGLIRFDRINNK